MMSSPQAERPAGTRGGDSPRRRCGFLRAAVRTRRSRTPPVDHTRALRPAIGRGHVTEPQMERREARVSPIARRCAPVSSRDGAGNEDVAPRGAPSPLIYEMRDGTTGAPGAGQRTRAMMHACTSSAKCAGCLTIASGRRGPSAAFNPPHPEGRAKPASRRTRRPQRAPAFMVRDASLTRCFSP